MKFFVPKGITRKSKNFPRHFDVLIRSFGEGEWHCDLESVERGQWVIVVRCLGSKGLSRTSAAEVGVPCAFDILSDDEIAAVRTRGGRILLDLGWEMLNPTTEIVAGLAATLSEISLDPSQVFIFHSNLTARRKFNRLWLEISPTPPPVTIEYPVGMALFVIHQQSKRDDAYIEKRRDDAAERTSSDTRTKYFVSFNGEVRPQRLYIAAALKNLGIFDKGYYSLLYPAKNFGESRESFRRRNLKLINKLPRGDELSCAALEILDSLPIKLDLFALPGGYLEELAWESQDSFYYDDARFTIVVDTSIFEEDSLFVTEKALKPIMNYSPFLLIGSPGGVDLLRSYGFRTFEPFLRQSETDNPLQILTSAIDEIHRVSTLDADAIGAFSRGLVQTSDYNAAHFWNGFPSLLKHRFISCLAVLGPSVSAT